MYALKKTLAELDWNTIIILGAAQGFATGLDVSGGGKVIADFVLNLFGGDNASPVILMGRRRYCYHRTDQLYVQLRPGRHDDANLH